MISFATIEKATKQANSEVEYLKEIMPNGIFNLIGIDGNKVLISAFCGMHETNEKEIKDIKEKSRLGVITEEKYDLVYRAEFFLFIH